MRQPGVEGEQERHVVARIVVAHLEAHIGPGQGQLGNRSRTARARAGAWSRRCGADRGGRDGHVGVRLPRATASAAAARSAWLSSSTSRRDSSSRTANRSARVERASPA